MHYKIWIILCFASLAFSCEAQKPAYTNQLAKETSPYLLQHANNPVDWNPWGEAALQKAQKEDKLLIISVGYAACHWCHVMEHESFEDTTVARIMNDNFISIKVDREERPDIDAIYMDACQLASGGACGWPLNVFALPDGRPVWAGTYFPKKRWIEMLDYFIKLYADSPEKLVEYAVRLTEGIQSQSDLGPTKEATLDFDLAALKDPVDGFKARIDPKLGGQKGAPKFPMPNAQELLLTWNYLTGDEEALTLLQTTLDQMAQGGIYDHLGGGFARYATDDQWRVPHFEKMLYDNSQLVSLYAKAYAATGKELYRRIVEETLVFVERELKDENGGFYSSLDADSEGEEGKFYVWEKTELEAMLKKEPYFDQFLEYFQIKESGNWEDDKNIFYTTQSIEAFAETKDLDVEVLKRAFSGMQEKLFAKRDQRVRPGLDNKILTSWNALMLQGYLDAYRYLGDEHYLAIAKENASFLLKFMQKEDGRLLRTFNKDQAKINAFLDDYAALAMAFANLYEATFDEQWLLEAESLLEYVNVHFYNEEKSLYNYTSDMDPPLVARKFELSDRAIPSSNSMMARSLFKVGTLLYKETYLDRSRKMFNQIAPQALNPDQASFFSNWLHLYLALAKTPYEVAIVGPNYQQLKRTFQMDFRPDAFFLGGAKEGRLDLLQAKLQEGETYIYVCQNKVCQFPVQEVAAARKQMD